MELYLDCAAHLPLNPIAAKVYSDFMKSKAGHGNPASPSVPGNLARAALEKSREEISSLLKVRPEQLSFTSTCTQAAEWALNIFEKIPCDNNDIHVSPLEHPAIRYNTKSYSKLKITNGIINTDQNYNKVICIHVQNETGLIQPINNIKCNYLFTDMCQSLGKIDINLDNIDIAIFGAHKFAGPANVGFIYLKEPAFWRPFGSGSRYSRDRSGTMDVASIVATSVALKDALLTAPERSERAFAFKQVLEPGLKELGFKIVAEGQERCPHIIFAMVPNKKARILLNKLGESGIYIGLGSACGSFHTGNIPTMEALGIKATIDDVIRISNWGYYDAHDAKQVLHIMNSILRKNE